MDCRTIFCGSAHSKGFAARIDLNEGIDKNYIFPRCEEVRAHSMSAACGKESGIDSAGVTLRFQD